MCPSVHCNMLCRLQTSALTSKRLLSSMSEKETESDQWGSGLSFSIPSDDTLAFSEISADFIDGEGTKNTDELGTTTDMTAPSKSFDTQPSPVASNETLELPTSNESPATEATQVTDTKSPNDEPATVEKPLKKAEIVKTHSEKSHKPHRRTPGFGITTTKATEARCQCLKQKSALEKAREELERERVQEERKKRRRLAKAINTEVAKEQTTDEGREKKLANDAKTVAALDGAVQRAKTSEHVVRRSDRSLIIPSCRNRRKKEEAEMIARP